MMKTRRENILIVDDEESIRTILAEKLSQEGYPVMTAPGAEEAWKRLGEARVDLVLADIKMPGRSGVDLLRDIRENHPDIAVIMITAVIDLNVAVGTLKLGAADYITKPFNLEEIALSVERALEHRRLLIENREYQVNLEKKVSEQTSEIERLLVENAKTRVLDGIYEISQFVASMEHLATTLERILSAVVRLVRADRGALFLYNPRADQLVMECNEGVGNRGIQELTSFATQLLASTERKRPFFSADPSADERLEAHRYVKRNRLVSIACVPLRIGERLLGTLYVDAREEPFDLSIFGEDFFRVFGNLAAIALDNTIAHSSLRREVQVLKSEIDRQYRYEDIIGVSRPMQDIFSLVEKVKNTDATVLIMGESGTGKEMIARLLHRLGLRCEKPFVAVNCAAIPHDLLESELFGIERGTATGVSERIGKFEAAEGGTVFLDEIGDLSPLAQSKILRVLQDKTIERLGSNRVIPVDIRLIAATNVDLRKAVEKKEFREDLFYRLNVLPIYIPPLRDRREDVPHLVRHYVQRFCAELKKPLLQIDDRAMETYVRPSWRGNIRELKNAIERAVILSEGEWLLPYEDTQLRRPSSSTSHLDLEPALNQSLSEQELVNAYARLAFERFKRFDRTSEFLGISFKTLKKRLGAEAAAGE